MLIYPSAAYSLISLLIRSSIIFMIFVASDDINASVLRLEDIGRVAATEPIIEITGKIVTTMPVAIVTGFITLNAHATRMGADIAATAAFLLSRAFILKAVIVVFGSSGGFLVGNILRLVVREYTYLLANPGI